MKRYLWIFGAFLMCIGLMTGCSSDNDNNVNQDTAPGFVKTEQNNEPSEDEDTVNITLSMDEEKQFIDEKQVVVEEGDTLMELLKGNFVVKEEDGFINSIEGVGAEGDEEKAWMIFINGEMAEKGAEDLELSPGDDIDLDFQEY